MNNHILVKRWDLITHPCPNFSGGLVEPPLELGHGGVITFHTKPWVWSRIHALVSVNHVSKRTTVNGWHRGVWIGRPGSISFLNLVIKKHSFEFEFKDEPESNARSGARLSKVYACTGGCLLNEVIVKLLGCSWCPIYTLSLKVPLNQTNGTNILIHLYLTSLMMSSFITITVGHLCDPKSIESNVVTKWTNMK